MIFHERIKKARIFIVLAFLFFMDLIKSNKYTMEIEKVGDREKGLALLEEKKLSDSKHEK